MADGVALAHLPHYDVIVIGGGPAGSTLATLVAKRGHSVALLDKTRFPRYQIGESLWIATGDIFDAIGAADAVRRAGFASKSGGTFVWGPIESPWSIYFAEPNGSVSKGYHVDRTTFDALLLDHARQAGVEVILEATVLELQREANRINGVRASISHETITLEASYVVNASGLRSRKGLEPVEDTQPSRYTSLSVWTYFRNIERLPPPNEENVLTAMFPDGWCWMIPLANDVTSVGVVLDIDAIKRVPSVDHLSRLFLDSIAACPFVSERLARARRSADYRSCIYRPRNLRRYHADGYLAVGDAACFIDPVLSTGVHLGMSGACYGAYALNTILDGGSEQLALEAFDKFYRTDHATYQADTDDLYAMNAHEPNPFWQQRQPLSVSGDRRKIQLETLKFCRHIGMHHGDMKAISRLQAAQMNRLYKERGIGRFARAEFMHERLHLRKSGPNVSDGYVMGDMCDGRFRTSLVTTSLTGQVAEVTPPDLTIFELCDGTRNVRNVISTLRGKHDLRDFDEPDLAITVGRWVDLGVLELAE